MIAARGFSHYRASCGDPPHRRRPGDFMSFHPGRRHFLEAGMIDAYRDARYDAGRDKLPIQVRKGAAMDPFNPDTWKQQWEVFMSARYIIISFVAGAGVIGWWLRGLKSERRIDGLEGRIAVFEDRLKLAGRKAVTANEARDDVIRQFQTYKTEVTATAGNTTLAAMAAKLEIALAKLGAANNAVGSAIGAARISGVSSMRVQLVETGKDS